MLLQLAVEAHRAHRAAHLGKLLRVAGGAPAERQHATAADEATAARGGGGGGFWFEAVVTTFETLLLEERKLRGVPWSAVVIDEAQRLKNPSCRARTTVDGLRYDAIALLTGTPVQNNASELFSLLNLIDPRKFNDAASFDAAAQAKNFLGCWVWLVVYDRESVLLLPRVNIEREREREH